MKENTVFLKSNYSNKHEIQTLSVYIYKYVLNNYDNNLKLESRILKSSSVNKSRHVLLFNYLCPRFPLKLCHQKITKVQCVCNAKRKYKFERKLDQEILEYRKFAFSYRHLFAV